LLIGGKKRRGGCKNNTGRGLTLFAYLGPGPYGNIETTVFEGSAPNLQAAVQDFKDEAHVWQFTGAKGLSNLCLELGVPQV